MHYRIGTSGQVLSFMPAVLVHFRHHRQIRWWHKEAGGLLFASLSPSEVEVVKATGPRPTDRRSRWHYIPDRMAEQEEIDNHYRKGLHFIGFWHTHPEKVPRPSPIDSKSISESILQSTHQLNGFVQVIVGLSEFPEGLFVGVGDGSETYKL